MDSWSDDDDWFYESIKRYKTLLMFDFSSTIEYVEFIDLNSICLIFEKKDGRNEISCVSLPKKLTVSREQEGLEKDTDFKVLGGGFSVNPLEQVKIINGTNSIIASEKDKCGLSIYKIPTEKSGIIQHVHTINSDINSPSLAHNKLDSLVMVNNFKNGVVLLDTKELMIKGKIILEDGKGENKISPEFLSYDSLGLCDTETGTTTVYDIRSSRVCHSFLTDHSFPKDQWSLSSSFFSTSHIADNTDETKLGLLSTTGIICIHDIRNPQKPLSCEKGKDLCNSSIKRCRPKLQFTASNFSIISISGFNSNVYIYDFSSENMKNVFVHDGHHRESSICENVTTDHIWFRGSVISACDNFSLHCWEYCV